MLSTRTKHAADWISRLSAEARESLERIKITRKLSKGQVLWRQGEWATEIARIESGSLKVADLCSYNQDFFFSMAKVGDCIGDIPAVAGLRHGYTLEAREASTLAVWKLDDVLVLNNQFPEICHQMMVSASTLTAVICERLEHSTLLSIRDRLSLQLQTLLRSSGVNEDGGVVHLQGVSHEDIGNMLGCARPTVSRELKAMEAQGLLALSYGSIRILDIEAFDQYCNSLAAERIA